MDVSDRQVGFCSPELSSSALKTWLIYQEVAYCCICQMTVMIVKHFKWSEPDGAIPAFRSWTCCVPATRCLYAATRVRELKQCFLLSL